MRSKKILLEAYKLNKFGFGYSQPYLFSIKAVNDEMTWLLKHVFISGLDKASNNAYFICISHIRQQALERLNSIDFLPCVANDIWTSLEDATTSIQENIYELIPDIYSDSHELPYIMAIFKFHKKKYRWITNAFGSIYVNLATLITVATMTLLEEVKQWAKTTLT